MDYGFPQGQQHMQQVGVAQTAISHNPMSSNVNMEDVSPGSQDDYTIKGLNSLSIFAKPNIKTTKGQSHLLEKLHPLIRVLDGLPAKKRGPKRDSKPAQSRRQELNRHAQR